MEALLNVQSVRDGLIVQCLAPPLGQLRVSLSHALLNRQSKFLPVTHDWHIGLNRDPDRGRCI